MSKPFLSLTLEREGKMIQLCANHAGIDRFIQALQLVKEEGHLHLWDSSIGGRFGFLSDKDPHGADTIMELSMTTGDVE
jgi:hypothetical protein